MESITYFTSSRGILKSCKSRNLSPISSSDSIDKIILDNHNKNGSIYICTDALIKFSYDYLDKIIYPFTLVTGDSDTPITNNLIQHESIQRILNNSNLINWFAQNLIANHSKLIALPIGLDYHTMWERPNTWGIKQQTAIAQEVLLINTLRSSPDLADRILAGYCNWHFQIERGDRKECLNKINKEFCLFENNFLPRKSTWERQAECMFVISPEGAGMDCHRTWEALLLGCIPVVRRSRFTDIFNNLPVYIVDDWSEFSFSNGIKIINLFQELEFDFNYLFNKYWSNKINAEIEFKIPNMTMKKFRSFLTSEAH